MKKIISWVGLFLLMGACFAWAEQIQVVGSVDKNQAQVDEEIQLSVRILGTHGNLQAPRLPAFQGFDSFYTGRTSHFSFVNGKSSSTVEFNYVLVPKVAGRYTLQPVEVWVDGKSYKTQPLEVEVMGFQQVQPAAAQPQTAYPSTKTQTSQPPAPPASTVPQVSSVAQPPAAFVQDDNLFVKAAVDKQTVYPNEQILLTYSLFTRYDTRYEGFEEEPSVSGFWIEDFPLDRDLGRDNVTYQGKRYVKADIRKIALFPTAPAQYTIQPGVLKVSIREEPKSTSPFDEFFGDSFFSGSSIFARRADRLLKPAPITIQVKPFPEAGKPASFNGAVGRFQISASVDRSKVKQNEPVTLKLVVEGEGNIETLPKPALPELTGFKIYDGDASSQLLRAGDNLAGKKTFEMIFIPTEAGPLSIPPLEFSFFDPRRAAYQVLRTQPFPLEVTPSQEPFRLPAELQEKEAFKKEVKLEAQDIRFIHEEFPSERAQRIQSWVYKGFLGADLVGVLLVGFGLLKRRREELFSRDEALRRRKLARTGAFRRLKALKHLAQSHKEEEAEQFMEEAEKVLTEYLCHKFNVSYYEFTQSWLSDKLTEIWGAEDPLLKEIDEFYDTASETRFGRGMLLAEERRRFFELIETVIHRVEKLPANRLK